MIKLVPIKKAKIYNRNKNQPTVQDEPGVSIAGDSPILAVFRKAAQNLIERHDRHELLVRLSRDITIESKRIIFLLHSAPTKAKSQEDIINEANKRIKKLIYGPIKDIAIETDRIPAHLHMKAVTAGLQEFVEARTLCSLMEHKEIITYKSVQNELSYTIKSEDDNERTILTCLPPLDYMLGLADLTGEIMRKAINGIASGNSKQCFYECDVLRTIYAGFLGLFGAGQLISGKLNTARANVYKVEQALYAISVRGIEASPNMELVTAPPLHRNHWDDREIDQGCFE